MAMTRPPLTAPRLPRTEEESTGPASSSGGGAASLTGNSHPRLATDRSAARIKAGRDTFHTGRRENRPTSPHRRRWRRRPPANPPPSR